MVLSEVVVQERVKLRLPLPSGAVVHAEELADVQERHDEEVEGFKLASLKS
jgi:hypothetical protein